MSICRDIDSLTPEMAKRTKATMMELKKTNIDAVVFETTRSQGVQNAYYAQGREPLKKVNELRLKEGLYPITEKENKNVITQTLKSRHIGGGAVDIVPVSKDGGIWWNAPFEVWESIGLIAEKNGLDWCFAGKGNQWKWDLPHYELLKNWVKDV